MLYINHDNPTVQNAMKAQAILTRLEKECQREAYSAARKADRVSAGKAKVILFNAASHIAEEIRVTPACWIEG